MAGGVGGKQVMRLELTDVGRSPSRVYGNVGVATVARARLSPLSRQRRRRRSSYPPPHAGDLSGGAFAPGYCEPATRQDLLRPYEGSDLLAYAVDPRIGRVGEDDAALLTPYQAAQGSLF